MTEGIFDVLLLLARPAAGKSEIIDYLLKCDPESRINRFHIGDIEAIDDFPMLWTWFEEDALLTKMGQSRIHTDNEGYFIGDFLWDLLVERLCLEYEKMARELESNQTIIIEFSRGKEHGGYKRAFNHLSKNILPRMAILYVNVSWEESLRKNRKRFNPQRPDSILEHGLPDAKIEKLYRETDWDEITADNPQFITIQGKDVPYVVFENEDDITTARGEAIGNRLEKVLARLWDLYRE